MNPRSLKHLLISFCIAGFTTASAQETKPAPAPPPPPAARPDSAAPRFQPLLAEDVYQNIKLMKGKEATAVLPMMLALRRMLGTDCSYCHIGWQWEKEDIKAKQTTRMMFHLTEYINSTLFEGKERVNCWTCHRYQPLPPKYPVPKSKPPEREMAEAIMALTPEQAAKPAEQVFHNIKSMKGVSAGQLPMVMAYFSRSLGVSCRHCHEISDFSSDEKPAKDIARSMLGMVQGTSRNFYNGGNTPVECYNCHQGQSRPPQGMPEASVQ
jgi:hypothetical protein